MVEPRDIVGRVNCRRECVSFQYWIKNDKGKPVQLVTYTKTDYDAWIAEAIFDDLTVWRSSIDPVTYGSLVNIAANGLLKLQSFLERRAQDDQQLCYFVSNETRGM